MFGEDGIMAVSRQTGAAAFRQPPEPPHHKHRNPPDLQKRQQEGAENGRGFAGGRSQAGGCLQAAARTAAKPEGFCGEAPACALVYGFAANLGAGGRECGGFAAAPAHFRNPAQKFKKILKAIAYYCRIWYNVND